LRTAGGRAARTRHARGRALGRAPDQPRRRARARRGPAARQETPRRRRRHRRRAHPPELPRRPTPSQRRHVSKRGRSRWLKALALGFVLVLLLGMAAFGWLLMGYPDRKGPGSGRVVEVVLEPGASVGQAAQALAAAGALREPWLFALHARVRGAA